MGSISIRKSIRWIPDEASEPTSTVVLTSLKRKFVDLRIFLKALQASRGTIVLKDLDWGIAGTSSSTKIGEKDGKDLTRGKWEHWIDSRHENAPADEGDMVEIEQGLTLETGRMVNPETGRETDYEEVWEDEEPVEVPGGKNGVKCVVLMMDDDERRAKGMVVLLGKWCQGIMRVGESVEAERWSCEKEDEAWRRVVKLGDGTGLPCEEVFKAVKDGRVEVGKSFEKDGRVWEVIEVA